MFGLIIFVFLMRRVKTSMGSAASTLAPAGRIKTLLKDFLSLYSLPATSKRLCLLHRQLTSSGRRLPYSEDQPLVYRNLAVFTFAGAEPGVNATSTFLPAMLAKGCAV